MLALVLATDKEMQAALSPFGPPPVLEQGQWARLSLPSREVLVLVTGVSVVNAGLRLGRLLAKERVDGVLNLGLAGSFDPAGLPLGATAVAASETWPEIGLWRSRGVDHQGLGLALHQDALGEVVQRLDLEPEAQARAMGLHPDPAWPRAAGLTVSQVTGTRARARLLAGRYNAQMENMEGFALALGCRQARLPFLEVRCVSNRVGPRQKGGWNLLLSLRALGRAAEQLLSAKSQAQGGEACGP